MTYGPIVDSFIDPLSLNQSSLIAHHSELKTTLLVTVGRSRKRRQTVAFRVFIMGGTGQVGASVVRALAAEPSCTEVVMVNRKATSLTANPRLRQVIVDTSATRFSADVATLAQSMVVQGDRVYGASCV